MKLLKITLLSTLVAAASLHGAVLNFDCLQPANNANCTTVAAQMQVTLTDEGGGSVSYLFENLGPIGSIITQINWDDDDAVLASFDSIVNGAGVTMLIVSPPGAVSGGGVVFPNSDADFQAERQNQGGVSNGINPGEQMTAFFTLAAGMTFQDLVDSYGTGGNNRIGMHVQSIQPSGGSDFMINGPPPPETGNVPEPSTYALMGVGLLALGTVGRCKRN